MPKGRVNFLESITVIHSTDRKYYSKFEYEMRAKINIDIPSSFKEPDVNYQAQVLKNVMYYGDFLSKLKLKFT